MIKNINENVTDDGLILPPKSRLEKLIDEANEAKETFDESAYIIETHHYYLQAVQNQDPKAHLFLDEEDWKNNGSPIWDEESTFEEFLIATRKEIVENRLPEQKAKLKGLADSMSPFQKSIEGIASDLVMTDDSEFQKIDKVMYELMEYLLNKQKEAIDKFLAGKIKILETEILDSEINNEIGKIANKIVSKKISGFNKQSNIIQ